MSGSGSSGGFGSGGNGGHIDCSKFSFETHINSPDPTEVAKLSVGDILEIVLAIRGTVEVVQVLNGSNVVGGIVDRAPSLKQCLDKGFKFTATVRSISGAAVKIYVESA
jgi:hypothetical protein